MGQGSTVLAVAAHIAAVATAWFPRRRRRHRIPEEMITNIPSSDAFDAHAEWMTAAVASVGFVCLFAVIPFVLGFVCFAVRSLFVRMSFRLWDENDNRDENNDLNVRTTLFLLAMAIIAIWRLFVIVFFFCMWLTVKCSYSACCLKFYVSKTKKGTIKMIQRCQRRQKLQYDVYFSCVKWRFDE